MSHNKIVKPTQWGKCGTDRDEEFFLNGTNIFIRDLLRVGGIARECVKGFLAFRALGPCVTVFGSARFSESDVYYRLSLELGHAIADAGFTVMTGGGPD